MVPVLRQRITSLIYIYFEDLCKLLISIHTYEFSSNAWHFIWLQNNFQNTFRLYSNADSHLKNDVRRSSKF